MKSTILKQFGSGQITIPKKWREELKAPYFKATRRGHDIVLTPLETDNPNDPYPALFHEDKNGCSLTFPKGIPAGEFLKRLKKADKILENGKKVS